MVAGTRRHGWDARSERAAAVAGAIDAMKAGLGSPQPLAALARSAMFSPFHFHRIFRETTALTPARFLAALRMAEARRLLLHSTLSVTTISSRVGYASTGTFTTQFGRLVGVPPTRFRDLARSLGDELVHARLPLLSGRSCQRGGMTIAMSGAPRPESLVVAWLFPVEDRRQRPRRWILTTGAGGVRLPVTPGPGVYTAFSVVVPAEVRLVDALVDEQPESYLVGAARVSLDSDGSEPATVRVVLRQPRTTDPPLLAMTPLRWLVEARA